MLQPEKETQRGSQPEARSFGNDKAGFLLRYLGIFGALATFLWTAWTYFDTKRTEFEVRRLEASKPYLEKQLQLLTEATQVTAAIATSPDLATSKNKVDRFWQLYWGELALVEHGEVAPAMVTYRQLLERGAKGLELQQAALGVAHACREELAKSWNVEEWKFYPSSQKDK